MHQAGASNTLGFVVNCFLSSTTKPSVLTLLRLFIHNTVHCCVRGNAKLSLKLSYAVSASVLDLLKKNKQTETKQNLELLLVENTNQGPHLTSRRIFYSLAPQDTRRSCFPFYWYWYQSSPPERAVLERSPVYTTGGKHKRLMHPCLTLG